MKRLQVLVDDVGLDEIRRAARDCHMTTAAWVRRSLRMSLLHTGIPVDSVTKLASIRVAVKHSFPVGDIDAMLGEIERLRFARG